MKNRNAMFFILIFSLLSAPGCGNKEKIEVYQIPKEKNDALALPTNHPDMSKMSSESPAMTDNQIKSLRWNTPTGWIEKPAGNMRLASFSAKGKNGEAEISIVTLPGEAGGLLANLNRWRGQLDLPPLSENDLSAPGILEKKSLAGQEMTMVDFENSTPQSGTSKRMVAALFIKNGQSWFFKLTGEINTVSEVKSVFLDFLNQLEFL